jgi:RNA polymerase sigma factor (sigma-70 family)
MQVGADLTLIEASRRGDRDAFAEIIGRYQRAVYAVAFSGVRNRALADDVTQDTFVIAWRRLAELRDDSRLAAWLCGIARNRARELRRQTQRETVADVDAVMHTTTPYEELSEAETERIVAAALDQVPHVYREPLVLYYYEERSVDDVARSLGISAATTNKRLSRGRRYLASCVAIVERGLARRGPNPGLAASVLAVIGVTASASHVDASPAPVKGSTMHKLAIAAIVTASVGGAGALVVTATRSDAHAQTHSAGAAGASHAGGGAAGQAATTAGGRKSGALCDLLGTLERRDPSLAAGVTSTTTAASGGDGNDCASVGRHLAELEGDTTHGPNHRPDEDTCAKCAAHYTAACESEAWSVERRNCTLAAADLINAHLCAGGVAPTNEQPSAIPANLSCTTLGMHVAMTVQGAGLHTDVTDMPDQITAACDLGGWSLELRGCFAAASTLDALQACMMPAK